MKENRLKAQHYSELVRAVKERELNKLSKGHLFPRRPNVITGGVGVTFNRSRKQEQSQQVLWKKLSKRHPADFGWNSVAMFQGLYTELRFMKN